MKRAVIIEDNLIPSLSMENMLIDKGYEIDGKFESAQGAIELVRDKNPSLIILDIRLKGEKDGLEIASEIRTFSDVPILFVSALTDAKTLARINEISFAASLAKPFTEVDFFNALKKVDS